MTRRVFLTFAAVAFLLGTMAVPPASANGKVEGKAFAIEMVEFPQFCPVGMTMTGGVGIELYDDGTKRAKILDYAVYMDGNKGPVLIQTGKVRVLPGTEKYFDVEYYVPEKTPLGTYVFHLVVSTKAETLRVSHRVEITGHKLE